METYLVALDLAELVELPDVVSGGNEPAENLHLHDSFANVCIDIPCIPGIRH